MGTKSLLAIIGLVIFIVVFGILLVIKGVQSNAKKQEVKNTVVVNNTVNVTDIVRAPLVYKDLTVNVNSQIGTWTTKNSFFLTSSSGTFGSQGAQLLAIREAQFRLPQDTPADQIALGQLSKVAIKGRVKVVTKTELEAILGYNFDGPEFILGNNSLKTWQVGPVLLIENIVKL